MIFELESTPYFDFITTQADGTVADADSTPTCEVFEDANDTAILTPTVVKRTAKTGDYRVPIACTTANGFEVGKTYNVVVSATVASVASKGVVATFQLRPTQWRGAVVADGGNTATTFKTNLASAVNDSCKDMLLVMVTGATAPQVKKVSAYNGTTKFVTLSSALTGTPAATDVFELINQ